MPKLNTTIDNLELKSNKVTATTPSSSWTDAQYPSAKALYSAYSKLVNVAHPVGSIMITSTNANPASTVGGTWELIDKGFTAFAASGANFFTPATNVSESGTFVARAGNTLRIRAALTINAEATDTGMTLGTFNLSSIGVTSLATDFTGSVSYSDGSNCGVSWNIVSNTGVLSLTDVFDATKLVTGNAFSFDITVPVIYTQMLDSFCDKFYWKRTA